MQIEDSGNSTSQPDPSDDQSPDFEVLSRSIVRTKPPEGAHCRFRIAPDGHLEIECDLHDGRRALIHLLEQMLRETRALEPE